MSSSQPRIGVKDGSHMAIAYRQDLLNAGFYEENDKFYKDNATKRQQNRIRQYCRDHHLKFFYDNEYGERSSNYRRLYFQYHEPDAKGRYRCVYCGRKYPKNMITVDHIYPVAQVSKSLKLQKKIKKKGIPSLNSVENLVAACRACNQAKSDKMGKWIRKGRLGQHAWYWTMRKIGFGILLLLLLIAIACIYLVLFQPGLWQQISSRF